MLAEEEKVLSTGSNMSDIVGKVKAINRKQCAIAALSVLAIGTVATMLYGSDS